MYALQLMGAAVNLFCRPAVSQSRSELSYGLSRIAKTAQSISLEPFMSRVPRKIGVENLCLETRLFVVKVLKNLIKNFCGRISWENWLLVCGVILLNLLENNFWRRKFLVGGNF